MQVVPQFNCGLAAGCQGPSWFHEEQDNAAGECECASGGRNEMIIGRFKVHTEKFDGFAGRGETQAGVWAIISTALNLEIIPDNS